MWSNASAGTDHGWANVVLPPANRVFCGDTPGLFKLSESNQISATDFRSVYATAFESILAVDPKPFLGDTFPVQPFMPILRPALSVCPRSSPRPDRISRPAAPAARSYRAKHG